MSDELTREERLSVDIDTRLTRLWELAWEQAPPEDLCGTFGTFIRAAYGIGYCDCLREVRAGTPAVLHRTHGYRFTT